MASQKNQTNRIVYAGLGIPFGAAIGLIFGLLLLDQMIIGVFIGAATGLIVGAIVDAQAGKEDS
jgi:uncharacterized membrane protein